DTNLAAGQRMTLQPLGTSDKILVQLRLVDLVKKLTAVVVVVWITSDGCQRVRCEGDEVLQCESACDVLGMRVEPAILVNDQNSRQFGRGRATRFLAERPDEIPSDIAISIG